MKFNRLRSLTAPIVFLCCLNGWAQTNPPAPAPAKPKNPFETVPLGQAPAAEPAKPQLETPKPAPGEPAATQGAVAPADVIEGVEFRGSRRIPQETLRSRILTKKGDKFDAETLQRDYMALWNTGYFDDLALEREPGPNGGWIVRFNVTERRVVRSIKYDGMKSVTVSEILDRFKERKVGLSIEQQYDPSKVQRAANVLREYLAERGRQFAVVAPRIQQIPPSSLEVVFKVSEGPKVKVGNITVEGNSVFDERTVRRAMKNLRPVGVPHSILLENMFAKSFDRSKLDIDEEMVRNYYQERGYFTARVIDSNVKVRDVGGKGVKIPLFHPNKPGKRADIQVNVEEGGLYRLNKINFVGVKLFKAPDALMGPLFGMSEGDVFSTGKLRKGMENLRKLYGEFGFIDMVPEPEPQPLPNGKIDLTFNIDEGKQFFVRRIDFSGNTTTRDKVIRREILIDEGQIYNTRLWEVSILRLNQLGYFEALKAEDAATISRDPKTSTVDLTLKVKERGKNSIQLNGGVSGIAGSFIGFSYSTNNFLGLGETLSLDSQLGDRIRNVTFGFTEPYFLDRPMSVGFTLYTTRFNYDQAREVSLLSGRNLIPLYEQLGSSNLLNYVSNGYGFTSFLSYPMRKLSFARFGLSYGYDTSRITTLTSASDAYFNYINFQNLSGTTNSLTGIRTSKVVPSFTYNTVNHPITPTAGKSLSLSTTFAGSVLGGNVNMIEPTMEAKYFRGGFKKGHVIGARVLGRFVTGYGDRVAPPFNRFYMGGEMDVRGFNIWGIGPYAYIPSSSEVPVLNNDGSQRYQQTVTNGVVTRNEVKQTIPTYQLVFPGGDTQGLVNLEYRIPIFGPVILAYFFDAGVNRITRPGQLSMNPDRISQLNGLFPQAGFDARAKIAPGTQDMRTSTGLELQVMMPVVNAPFRLYWAYNPNRADTVLQAPVVVDRSYFPNNQTFLNSLQYIGAANVYQEKRSTFRFSIGRTF